MGGEGGIVFWNMYKDYMEKPKGVRIKGGSGYGWVGEVVEEKRRELYLNNNKKKFKKKRCPGSLSYLQLEE